MTSKKYRGLPPKKPKVKKPRLTDRVIELENRMAAIERAMWPGGASPEPVPEPAPAEEVKI